LIAAIAGVPLGIGIYTSTGPFSLEGEGWDEGEYKWLFLFSSPQPSPAGEGELGCFVTHCIYNAKKLCRYLCSSGKAQPHNGLRFSLATSNPELGFYKCAV